MSSGFTVFVVSALCHRRSNTLFLLRNRFAMSLVSSVRQEFYFQRISLGLLHTFTNSLPFPSILFRKVCTGNPTLASAGWLGVSGFWLPFPTLASSMHRISCKYWPCFFDDTTSVYPQPHLHFSSYFWRISSGEANRPNRGREHMSEWRHRPFRKGLGCWKDAARDFDRWMALVDDFVSFLILR